MKTKTKFIILMICLMQFALLNLSAQADLGKLVSDADPFDRKVPLSATLEAVLTAKNGKQSVMKYNMYSKRSSEKIQVMIDFFEPKTYQGTRLLTTVPVGGGNPQVKMMKAIYNVPLVINSPSDTTSFFGMDFTSGDMNPRNPALDTYKNLGEQKLSDGTPVTVIEATPIKKTLYEKKIHYIDMTKKMILRSEVFNSSGVQLKLMEVLETKKVDGVWSAIKTKMTTLAAETNTVLTYTDLKYNVDVSAYITEEYLKTGTLE